MRLATHIFFSRVESVQLLATQVSRPPPAQWSLMLLILLRGQSLLWNHMHFYWKNCPWCPLPGHPQRKRGILLQYLSPQGLCLPSTYRSLLQHRFCSDVPASPEDGCSRNVSRFFCVSSSLWNREAILRATLLWTQGGPVSRSDGQTASSRGGGCYLLLSQRNGVTLALAAPGRSLFILITVQSTRS